MRFFEWAALALSFALGLAGLDARAEEELNGAEAEAAVRDIAATFKDAPRIRAKIVSEIDDIAGTRSEEGVMLLERPGKLLRRFTKPRQKTWLLNGAELIEYSAGQPTAMVKDFTGAPGLLKQIQGVMSGDFAALEASYAMKIFAAGSKDKRWLRIVFDKKPGINKHNFKSIVALLGPGFKFFSTIRYIPDEGDTITEHFDDIKIVEQFDSADFELPKGVERKVEKISE